MGYLIFLAIIILAAVLFIEWKMPVWIGKSGERFVSSRFNQLDPMRYKVLDDLMLPSQGKVSATQIDHVIVSNHGIFCVETKSYKGWIFGNASQQYWTQVIYRNKQRFYNPLRQNFAHTKAIEALLCSHLKAPIVSFVVFPDADKLKISGTDAAGYPGEIMEKIQSHVTTIYSDVERDIIVDLLMSANITNKEARQDHIREIREIKG